MNGRVDIRMIFCDHLVAGANTTPCRRPAVSVQHCRQAARSSYVPDSPGIRAAAHSRTPQWLCWHSRRLELSSWRGGNRRLTPCQAAATLNEVQFQQPGADLEQVCSGQERALLEQPELFLQPHRECQTLEPPLTHPVVTLLSNFA